MKSLKLAKDLALPLEVVTQKLAWLGVTGSGKTYGASKLAELLWDAGAQFIVLDPVGVWYGLRLAKDGKKPSDITVPIFGGLHGDVPIEATGGALLADLVVDRTLSAIIDVSQFESDAQKARFAADFADRLFMRKKAAPSALHLFLEEVQEFVPQNHQRGEERMLHVFTRMQKLGRNYGIGSSYISQRPQEVNKKALNMAQTLFVFRTTGTHERAAIEKWIEDKSLDEDIAGDLPKIPTGHCHVWSPEFLKISETVHILEKDTFNASATPEVGAAAVTRELAPIDLAKVRTAMAATIEKAKADDPRELRKEIAALQKQVAGKALTAVAVHLGKQQPLLTDADRTMLDNLRNRMDLILLELTGSEQAQLEELERRIGEALQRFAASYLPERERRRKEFGELLERVSFQKILGTLATVAPQQMPHRQAERITPARPSVPSAGTTLPGGLRNQARPAPSGPIAEDPRLVNAKGEFKKHTRALLTALAQHPEGRTREQTIILAGYVPSGDISTAFAGLLEHGLIQQNGSAVMTATPKGLQVLGPFDPLPTGSELRAYLLPRLSSAERKMLGALFDAYPSPEPRASLHERAGLKPSGDTSTAFGKFIKLGWANERDGGLVAADTFFEGTR